MVDLRLPHDGVAGHHGIQIALEHPLHVLRIRAAAAQVRRRLEGAAAGAVGKVLGVQYDACQQGLRLAFQHVGRFDQILHQLRDQLAGGAGVGLVVVQGHFVDVAAAPAVMIDDCHAGAALQQRFGLHAVGAVGVHHHQQSVRLGVEKRRVAVDQHARVLRHLLQSPQHGMGGVVFGINDDLGLFAQLAADAADARRRAQRVHVGVLVAHNVHVAGVVDQLPQGVGHNAGFYLGALLGGLGAAAVELEVVAVLHHRLVAAAAQGHLQRQIGVLEQAFKAVAVPAHADGQRGTDAAALHGAHCVQHVELLLGIDGEVLLLHHEQIPVPVIAQQQRAASGAPVVELALDIRQQRRAFALRAGLHQILIVVDHQNGHRGAGHVQRLAHLLRLGDVQPVGGGQHAVVALQLVGMAQCAVHPVGAVVPHHMLRRLPLALQHPVAVKAGDHVAHQRLKYLLLQVRQRQKPVVAPQDLSGVQVEHQHGQRRVQHVAGAGGVDAAADPVQILPHAVLGHPVAPDTHIDHQRGHQRLGNGQQRREGDSRHHKGGQAQAVQHDVGAEAADQLFTQGDTSFQRWENSGISR